MRVATKTKPAARANTPPELDRLKALLLDAADIGSAASVLRWDQSTYMPSGGAAARGRQLSRLSEIAHRKRTDPAIGKMLDKLQSYADHIDPKSDDARLLAVTRRDYERATRIPADYIARKSQASSASYAAWVKARPASDFATMCPHLEKTLEFSREYAAFFPGHDHVMDPLIGPDEGVTTKETKALFKALRAALVPLVQQITSQKETSDACLRKHYPQAQQLKFASQVARDMGYDETRGRLDLTAHPFMIRFGADDVRITTRVREDDLSDCLFSVWHEAGHAFYELGVSHDLNPPIAGGTSPGVHESQSRLWENLVGRSRGFWEHYYPALKREFPEQLRGVSLDTFYRAINTVSRSLIRTDADEVTYNLHVMIRFDLECDLLDGKLAVKDLPDAWNARYRSDLGVVAPDHTDGVLQDVHWYSGSLGGGFQGYTIGNVLSAQFYNAALKVHPEITSDISAGRFDTLHTWLKQNVYRHGRKFGVHDLVKQATGEKMRIEPYLAYLHAKYGALYELKA
jgi:carboxypeptidase Taq